MLINVKKGDIVARKSYNKDVIFIIDRIIGNRIAILSGITTRLKADSYVEDLEIIDKKEIQKVFNQIDKKIINQTQNAEIEKESIFRRSNRVVYTGKILHLDGDKRYSEKSNMYYKKMGLKAIVRNVTERNQANVVNALIDRYKPDILIVTWHDRNDKKG